MKLLLLSDLHGKLKKLLKKHRNKLPEADVLIISGDITSNGSIECLGGTLTRLTKQKELCGYNEIILIAGNHDKCFQDEHAWLAKEMCKEAGIIYLEDKAITIDGIKFYGSPHTPTFLSWYFMKNRGEDILAMWQLIPNDVDVLITHGPVAGIMDISIYDNVHCGCEDLRNEIFNRIKPKISVFGHIHNWYGIEKHDGIKFINASTVNEQYEVVNDPILIEV